MISKGLQENQRPGKLHGVVDSNRVANYSLTLPHAGSAAVGFKFIGISADGTY